MYQPSVAPAPPTVYQPGYTPTPAPALERINPVAVSDETRLTLAAETQAEAMLFDLA